MNSFYEYFLYIISWHDPDFLKRATESSSPCNLKIRSAGFPLRHLQPSSPFHCIYVDFYFERTEDEYIQILKHTCAAALTILSTLQMYEFCRGQAEQAHMEVYKGKNSNNHPVISPCDNNMSLHLHTNLCGRWCVYRGCDFVLQLKQLWSWG